MAAETRNGSAALGAAHVWPLVLAAVGAAALPMLQDAFRPGTAARTGAWEALVYVAAAAIACAGLGSRTAGESFWRCARASAVALGWIGLLFGCIAWDLRIGHAPSSFIALFPVTLPRAILGLASGGRKSLSWQVTVLLIGAVALFHLFWFWSQTSLATKSYLAALALMAIVHVLITRCSQPSTFHFLPSTVKRDRRAPRP